jgi:cytidine deaminase
MSDDYLIKAASDARSRAYACYSKFAVGAALLSNSGKVFQGCNVENVSLGLTMCAERVAVGSAVAQGVADFTAIAIVADSKLPILPCGACRQVLAEFNPAMRVVTSTIDGKRETVLLTDLLPRAKQGILEGSRDV